MCEADLSRLLALKVSVDRVVQTKPTGVRYEGVQLVDPETNAKIGRAASIGITRHGLETIVKIAEPEVDSQQIDGLKDIVMRQLRTGQVGERIRVTAPALKLQLPGATTSVYENITARVDHLKIGSQLAVEFFIVDRERNAKQAQQPVRIWVTRNRQTTPPNTELAIDAEDNNLPCVLVSSVFPIVSRLGNAATFSGGVRVVESADGWDGHVLGMFNQVDLTLLSTEQGLPQLTGSLMMPVDANFNASRLDKLRCQVLCAHGTIHSGLVERIADQLQINTPRKHNLSQQFSELKFEFRIDAEGLHVDKGLCESKPGAILVDKAGVPILELPEAKSVSLAALEEAFSQSRGALLSVLPLTNERPRQR